MRRRGGRSPASSVQIFEAAEISCPRGSPPSPPWSRNGRAWPRNASIRARRPRSFTWAWRHVSSRRRWPRRCSAVDCCTSTRTPSTGATSSAPSRSPSQGSARPPSIRTTSRRSPRRPPRFWPTARWPRSPPRSAPRECPRACCGATSRHRSPPQRPVSCAPPRNGRRRSRLSSTRFSGGTAARPRRLRPGRRARFKRTSCCLYYRVPGGGYCGDCVLTE